MTIVIAQRRREEILVLADTMVAEPGKTGPDIMPGRLKVVTVGPRVTIAFAGNADAADVAVRSARRELHCAGLMAAMEVLKQESHDGRTDFVVASHHPEASLVRLRNGVLLEVNDTCALGHDEPFRPLIDQARVLSDGKSLKRSDLRLRFIDRLMTNKNLGPHIGGFPIAIEAMPSGHRYLGHTGTYTYEFPTLKWGEETHQSLEQVYTGAGHFMCSVMPSQAVDVPVMGVCLLQARQGTFFRR